MKRGYTIEDYREMFGRIRKILPKAAVSSDFIVGFCGETEESHQKSLDLIRECRFKNSFIFKYSPRPGTKANDLQIDDIPEDVKKRRNNEMLTLQNQISAEDNATFIGSQVQVLVEGPSKSEVKRAEPAAIGGPVQLTGRTTCDRIVVFNGNPRLAGTMATISVEDCTPTTLIGQIVTQEIQHGSSALLPILV
jgi:tRNA-2-methylthio-N6-dimethylallyladenosine synthase